MVEYKDAIINSLIAFFFISKLAFVVPNEKGRWALSHSEWFGFVLRSFLRSERTIIILY